MWQAAAMAQAPIVTYNPVTVKAADRGLDIDLRITAPTTGARLPVVLFAHGAQYSKDDYLPLSEYWAAHGFLVIQPTLLDSTTVTLAANDPRKPDIWRQRVLDFSRILDAQSQIEAQAPALKGRIDWSRVVVVGHSYGGHTAAVLFGAQVKDPVTGKPVSLMDRRVSAAILMAPPGSGADEDLVPEWRTRSPFLKVDWSTMRHPVLVIVGDHDQGAPTMTVRDWHWHADPYVRAPTGGECLLVLPGSLHFMGGILGAHRTEVKDENPARVSEVQTATLAFLRTAVDAHDPAWPDMAAALKAKASPPDYFQCR
jgi:dienelactone hydrolase